MLLMILGLAFTAGALLMLTLGGALTDDRHKITRRLDAMARPVAPPGNAAPPSLADAALEGTWRLRLLTPLLKKITDLSLRLTPAGASERLQIALARAGKPMGAGEFVMLRVLSLVVCIGLSAMLCRAISAPPQRIVCLSLGLLGGLALPDLWLAGQTRRRHSQIRRALPDMVDLLVVSVEAGLGLGSALAKVTEKMSGPLPDELARALAETSLGKRRTQALKDMAVRVGVGELRTFVASITQAEILGVSITQTLRAQSQAVRAARVQRVREQAARLPVTLLLPLTVFIFPAVFIVLLGPSLIRLYAALSGMR